MSLVEFLMLFSINLDILVCMLGFWLFCKCVLAKLINDHTKEHMMINFANFNQAVHFTWLRVMIYLH